MKKSALLAVSALSLGVVGLATFTPVVNAVDSMTGDATVTVTVDEAISIGGNENFDPEGGPDQDDNDAFANAFNAQISVKGGEFAQSEQKQIVINNNSGRGGTLTIKATDTNLNAVGHSGAPIPAGTTTDGSASSWSYKVNDGAWTAVTTAGANVGTDNGTETSTFKVTYGASASKTQAAGQYQGTVTYTYALADLGD